MGTLEEVQLIFLPSDRARLLLSPVLFGKTLSGKLSMGNVVCFKRVFRGAGRLDALFRIMEIDAKRTFSNQGVHSLACHNFNHAVSVVARNRR